MRRTLVLIAILAAAVLVAHGCSAQQSISKFPVSLEPVVHVENHHFVELQPLDPHLPGIKSQWEAVEACTGKKLPIDSVAFYSALAIIVQDGDKWQSLWGVYFNDPPEIVISPLDVDSRDVLLRIVRHEIAHHFAGISGESFADHNDPVFLTCSGEEK